MSVRAKPPATDVPAGACAVVTGAAGGIGTAICERLAQAGIAVLGIDLRQPPPSTRLDHFLLADLDAVANSESEADATILAIARWLSGRPLGLLVNNAAVQCLGPVAALDRSLWRRSLNVNLLAPFFLIQALLAQLKAARGCVVNISSVHAKATKPQFVAYATTKAALSGMTRALAVDLGRDVAVYGIEPAAVQTEMLLQGFADSPQSLSRLADCHPSGRIATPQDVAELVYFLFTARIAGLQGSAIELGGGISGRLHDPD
jgi:NAD(P)-dependent dehydrogenase (short-subunit alcohol dehydrogenase family)